MAKTFKRTLIATLSVLCLLALSLFAAACSPAPNAYKVTLDYDREKGEVTLDPVQDTYDAGSDVTVTVTPKSDYEVGTFKVDGKDEQLTNGKYTFAVEKDTVVAVTFTQKTTTEDQYSITVTPTQNGTVLLSDPGPVASGTEITATVTPAPGYELDTAKVNGADVTVDGNNRFKFTVTADTTVTVTFKQIPVTKYNVSAAATQNGTVTLDPEGEVAENTEVTVTITPASGYELDTAKVNTTDFTSQVRDNRFKFTVTADTTVTVTFKSTTPPAPTTYNVSAANTTHGSVRLSHSGAVAVNTEVTVTITPDSGYELDTAKVNTTDFTSQVRDNSFTFTVTEDAVVTVTFKETVPPTPTVDIDEKWDGTFIGTNDEDDSEWKIDIDAENDSLTFYINGVDQHVSSVAFAPRDPENYFSMGDAYYFTHGDDTLYIYKRAADDDGKIYQIVVYVYSDVETSALTNTVELIDESKVPLEPPLGDTITAFPEDFRGTWYRTHFDGVDYVIDIQETTMTITVGDGDPTTIDVKDVLYNAHEDSMWEDPTLYFTYNGAEESTLELSDDNTLAFTSDYDYIYVYGFTHTKPVHYGDETAFLAEIEGVWSFPSIALGDTLFVVVDGDVTQFEFEGTDYTSSMYVHGLDEDGALVVEAGDELYHFTYDAENEALTVTNASGSEHELTKSEIKNTLPSEYVGKWVKINGAPYIVVAQDGTAKYYSDASSSGTDLKIVGIGSSYTFDYFMFDDGVIALHENHRVLSVDNFNYAKDGVEIPEAEKLPEDLRDTTWECAVAFDIDTFVFETDGLTVTADGDVKYHVYFVSHDSSSDAYTFNAYSGGDVYSFEYTHGVLYVNAEYTFRPAGGGDEEGLPSDCNGKWKAVYTEHTLDIEDGAVTLDGVAATDVTYDSDELRVTFTVNDVIYTADLNMLGAILTLKGGSVLDYFVKEGLNNAVTSEHDGNYVAVNDSDPEDTFDIVIGSGKITVDRSDADVAYVLETDDDTGHYIAYYMFVDGQFAELDFTPYGNYYQVGEIAYTVESPEEASDKISPDLYGVWRGNNEGDSYVVTIDDKGVHFVKGDNDPVDGTVSNIAANGLSFDVNVLFPGNMNPYNFHAVYSGSTGNLTLTEGDTVVTLTKDTPDMETIPSNYQGKWVLADFNTGEVIGSMEITKNTISMTLHGNSYGPISIIPDDVIGGKVTFTAGEHHYSISAAYGDPLLGDETNPLIASLQKEGDTVEIPETASGKYADNPDHTIIVEIKGQELTVTRNHGEPEVATVTKVAVVFVAASYSQKVTIDFTLGATSCRLVLSVSTWDGATGSVTIGDSDPVEIATYEMGDAETLKNLPSDWEEKWAKTWKGMSPAKNEYVITFSLVEGKATMSFTIGGVEQTVTHLRWDTTYKDNFTFKVTKDGSETDCKVDYSTNNNGELSVTVLDGEPGSLVRTVRLSASSGEDVGGSVGANGINTKLHGTWEGSNYFGDCTIKLEISGDSVYITVNGGARTLIEVSVIDGSGNSFKATVEGSEWEFSLNDGNQIVVDADSPINLSKTA